MSRTKGLYHPFGSSLLYNDDKIYKTMYLEREKSIWSYWSYLIDCPPLQFTLILWLLNLGPILTSQAHSNKVRNITAKVSKSYLSPLYRGLQSLLIISQLYKALSYKYTCHCLLLITHQLLHWLLVMQFPLSHYQVSHMHILSFKNLSSLHQNIHAYIKSFLI